MNGCCLINHRCEILSGDRVRRVEYLVEIAFTEHSQAKQEISVQKKIYKNKSRENI